MFFSWPQVAVFLTIGYLCMSRSFSYFGIPQWSIFPGEVVLACFLMFGPSTPKGRWLAEAVRFPPLRPFLKYFVLLFIYGIFQVFRGIQSGNAVMTSVRDLAFNYYPLYLFLGIWAGLRSPRSLQKLARGLAWVNGIYGTVFVLFLSNVSWMIPGVSRDVDAVPFFGQPLGSALALISLMAFEKDLWSVWDPLPTRNHATGKFAHAQVVSILISGSSAAARTESYTS